MRARGIPDLRYEVLDAFQVFGDLPARSVLVDEQDDGSHVPEIDGATREDSPHKYLNEGR